MQRKFQIVLSVSTVALLAMSALAQDTNGSSRPGGNMGADGSGSMTNPPSWVNGMAGSNGMGRSSSNNSTTNRWRSNDVGTTNSMNSPRERTDIDRANTPRDRSMILLIVDALGSLPMRSGQPSIHADSNTAQPTVPASNHRTA